MSNPRIILTPDLAREIYARKLALIEPKGLNSCVDSSTLLKGRSGPIANIYNVSAKTVRDIWNHKTWSFTTADMWLAEETRHDPPYPLKQVDFDSDTIESCDANNRVNMTFPVPVSPRQ